MMARPVLRICVGLSISLICLSSACGGQVDVWDAPAPAKGKELAVDVRTGWKPVKAVGGCAVMENSKLMLVFAPGSDAVVLYSKALKKAGDGKYTTVRLSVLTKGAVASDKNASSIRSAELTEYSRTGAVVLVTLDNDAQASFRLRTGKVFVEVTPVIGAAGVRISAVSRCVFRPDLYGTEVFYDPRMSIFQGRNSVPLVDEHYLISVLSNDSAIMYTWPDASQTAVLPISTVGGAGRFDGMDIGFGAGGRKSVFIALLESPGICYLVDLKNTKLNFRATGSSASVASLQPGWEPPFHSRWYTMIYYSERKPENSSLYPFARTYSLAAKVSRGKVRAWSKAGKNWTADERYNKPLRPAWYDGRRWQLDLEKEFQPFTAAVNYPMGRTTKTPAETFTVMDVLRETLPDSWEEILDIEGLKQRGTYRGENRMVPAACAAHAQFKKIEDQEEAREHAKAIERFYQVYHNRSLEYLKFAEKVREACTAAARRSPKSERLSEKLIVASREMESDWQKLSGEAGLDPAKWTPIMKQVYTVIDQWPADVNEKLGSMRDPIVLAGGGYDSFVTIARKTAQRINYIATIYGGENDATLKLSREVRSLCHQVLRRKYLREEQHDSSWSSKNNPARPGE